MVTNWVGLLDQRSKHVEYFHTRLKMMHVEARTIVDPIEQSNKFVEIQAKDDRLDAMDEVNKTMKTTL
jgi:hypothetical protein